MSSRDDILWVRPEPGERRPAHTREAIAAAALKVADTEGFEAVTMRRVAAELGAGTMTLYHYVRNKGELSALMGETIMGEMLIPAEEVPEGWREGLAEIARRTRRIFAAHPWIVDHMDDDERATWSPNELRHVEQSLAVAARTGLGPDDQLEIVAMVDDYVIGYALRAQEPSAEQRNFEATVAYLQTQLETGDFPHLAAAVGDDVRAGLERLFAGAVDEQRFERGLQRLLDGIALEIERRAR